MYIIFLNIIFIILENFQILFLLIHKIITDLLIMKIIKVK